MSTHELMTRSVLEAERRIRPFIRETPLDPSPYLDELTGARVHCKLENLQHTGSFKARGALNKILSIDSELRKRGVVAASTGNHGAAVAWALQQVNAPGIVFVPESATSTKTDAMKRLGLEIREVPGDPLESERSAREHSIQWGLPYISPYNDYAVVAGQGTVGVEIARQVELSRDPDPLEAVFISIGGGGLVSGVASYLKDQWPEVSIVGCSPENSKVMAESVRAGQILDLPSLPTLSDGTAGGVEPGAVTFEMCRDLVDRFVTVTEDEIAQCLLGFINSHHLLVEGAAAVAMASLRKLRSDFKGQRVAVVVCGANIGLETLLDL